MRDSAVTESPALMGEGRPGLVREIAEPARAAGAEVVFTFSFVSWQAAAARGWFMPEDRLARALVSHPRVARVLVADMMRSAPARVLRDAVGVVRGVPAPFPESGSAQLVRPVSMRRRYPTRLAAVERECARYERALRRRSAEMGLVRPAVITANPLIAGYCSFAGWAGPVTYYATDDWQAYGPHRAWWAAYEESFRRIRESGRRVCAITEAALRRVDPLGPGLVLPNGLDPDEWQGAAGESPAWAETAGRPLLLYVGSLESRIDVPALARLAADLPEAKIALVGPLLDEAHFAPLRSIPNVEFHEPIGREKLTALIRAADVGLIPHVDSELTRAMSPLKLYEYLAGGLPVVSAALDPVRGVSDRVELVPVGGDYAAGVGRALARGRLDETARLAFLAANSWQDRHEALLDFALAP